MEAIISNGSYQLFAYYFETQNPQDVQFVIDTVSAKLSADIKLKRVPFVDQANGETDYETMGLVTGTFNNDQRTDEFERAKKLIREKLDEHFGRGYHNQD